MKCDRLTEKKMSAPNIGSEVGEGKVSFPALFTSPLSEKEKFCFSSIFAIEEKKRLIQKKSVEFSHKSFLFFSARQKKLLNISSFQLKTFLFLQPLFFIYWGDNWRKLFSSQNGHLLTLQYFLSGLWKY